MALSKDEQDQLDALTAKAQQADEDDDNEPIEIWDKEGNGARLPAKHGREWLESHGFVAARKAPDDSGSDNGDDGNGDAKKPRGKTTPARAGAAQRYFGSSVKK